MNRRTTAILILLVLALGALPARAAFENIMVSPRARGMGDASVAVADRAFATYLNPAFLAGGDSDAAAGLSYVRPYGYAFHDLYYLGGAYRLAGRLGSVGVSYRQYGVDFQGVDLQKEGTVTVSHGLPVYEDLHSSIALGYGLNFYNLEFAETVGGLDPGDDWSVGMDLGLVATVHGRTRIGVLVHNVNAPKIGVDEEEIPRRLHAGVAYEPYAGVITTIELENVHGEKVQWHGGLEMELVENFFLRGGIMSEPSKLTAGFGYSLQGFAVNYGFSTGGGVLDSTHQFGLTMTWGGEAK